MAVMKELMQQIMFYYLSYHLLPFWAIAIYCNGRSQLQTISHSSSASVSWELMGRNSLRFTFRFLLFSMPSWTDGLSQVTQPRYGTGPYSLLVTLSSRGGEIAQLVKAYFKIIYHLKFYNSCMLIWHTLMSSIYLF